LTAKIAWVWANNRFTSDATFVLHYPDGTEQYRIEGREAIGKTFGRPWILESGDATLHREHRLRRANSEEREDATSALIQVSKRDQECASKEGALNGGQPVLSAIIVYHDTWVLEDGEWKKKLSILRRDT
jgi:hypothetical protein